MWQLAASWIRSQGLLITGHETELLSCFSSFWQVFTSCLRVTCNICIVQETFSSVFIRNKLIYHHCGDLNAWLHIYVHSGLTEVGVWFSQISSQISRLFALHHLLLQELCASDTVHFIIRCTGLDFQGLQRKVRILTLSLKTKGWVFPSQL